MNGISIQVSEDGSHTIFNQNIGESYHSIHGAYTESMHVFINNGMLYKKKSSLKILEIGFGTGLNAILALTEGVKRDIDILYDAIELYPLPEYIFNSLNYSEILTLNNNDVFLQLHNCPWNKQVQINMHFELRKIHADFINVELNSTYDIVFFDAFSPEKQPELWSAYVFEKIYKSMSKGGILTTYCSKGIVKQNLRNSGFVLERLPGPPGKRHMLRATKV